MSLIENINNNEYTFNYPADLIEFATSDNFLAEREDIKKNVAYKDYSFDEYTNTAIPGGKIDYSNIKNYLSPVFKKYGFSKLYVESLDDSNEIGWIPYIQEISFGPNVKSIPDCFLHDLKTIKVIQLSEGLESIGDEAFYGSSNLKEIVIPSSVKNIGSNICGNSMFVKKIEVNPANPRYASYDSNIIVDKTTNTVILGCSSSVIVEGIEVIGYRSFYCQKLLKNISMPKSVKRIEKEAFFGCLNLQKFEVDSITVEEDAFPFKI